MKFGVRDQMIICNEYCCPCCDYCIHVIQTLQENNNKIYTVNESCNIHPDSEYHLSMVLYGGYCQDFICKNAEYKRRKNESC